MILLGKTLLAHLLLSPCRTSCLHMDGLQVMEYNRYTQRSYGIGQASALSYTSDDEVGRDLWSTCGPTPWLKAGSARAVFSRSYPEGSWLFATSVGNLCLCSITLAEKKYLLMFRLCPRLLSPQRAPLERA